ncbi:hypothetical protein IFM89_027421 [Coptis chinensis]|uniref:Uncharacterized protein n=1 Tax=Coptis chinensis TaxID=261450 RepID=A0A835IRN2_9MAGN|nr:hypothetical protein IFM89_027421 [Coptis chinensis]
MNRIEHCFSFFSFISSISMDSLLKVLIASILLLLVAFVEETRGDAMHLLLCFFPHSGMKVRITCDSTEREETTNWFGSYTIRFEGSPDLSRCYAQLSGNGQGLTSCGAVPGPAQQLRLMFRMFDMEMYAVDSLLSQPAQPMSFCPRSSNPPPSPYRRMPTPVFPPSPPTVTFPPSPPRVTFLRAHRDLLPTYALL